MSEEKINLGPAFPSLRDYFAAAALTGAMAHDDDWGSIADLAEHAYIVADAMLKARAK